MAIKIPAPSKPPVLERIALILLSGLGFLAWYGWLSAHGQGVDSDRYFHLGVSRLMSEQGLLSPALPQVDHLGWASSYPDAEYLFHLLSSIAYRIAGETGALALVPVLGGAIFASLGIMVSSWLPSWGALICVTATLLNSFFMLRLLSFGPHALAILIFIWQIHSILRRNWMAVFVLGLLYSLSYHAIQYPLVVLALYGIFHWRERKASVRALSAGLGGLLAGFLLNPAFPSSLSMSVQQIRSAFASGVVEPGSGTVITGSSFLALFGPQLLCLGVSAYRVFQLQRQRRQVCRSSSRRMATPVLDPELAFLLALSCVLWIMAIGGSRTVDFSVPVTALLLGKALKGWTWRRSLSIGVVASLICVLQAPALVKKGATPGPLTGESMRLLEAIDRIPIQARGEKVFNTLPSMSSYLLYRRPDLRFIDALDSSFLKAQDAKKSEYRKTFSRGWIADPFSLARRIFGAAYVLTQEPALVEQLEADPNFRRLYPVLLPSMSTEVGHPFLYAVAEQRVPNQVLSFEGSVSSRELGGSELDLNPRDAAEWKPIPGAGSIPLTNLMSAFALRGPGGKVCGFVRPAESELRRHAGARWIGVGGGESLRLWVNGEPLLSALERAPAPRMVRVWVPLERPLEPSDHIEAMVCSDAAANYLGLALSFWTGDQVRALCEAKAQDQRDPWESARGWPFTLSAARTCLGEVAVPLKLARSF